MVDFELAVIGAGITGLNALHSAAQYLPAGAKVLLVERQDGLGGMWRQAYPFVRLHQPYQYFTVGNIPWALDEAPEYLATGQEVAAHLAECFDFVSKKLVLETRFGTDCRSIAEASDGTSASLDLWADGHSQTVTARRVIHAAGLDIPKLGPLLLRSDQVDSTAPSEVDLTADAPVYVIGGGKTGMDTAHALIQANPDRRVTLINGQGTCFASRDKTLPAGLARYWRGHLVLPVFREMAMLFNGQNEDEVFDAFRRTYALHVGPKAEHFLYGILSEGERDRIAAGLTEIVYDYLDDVIDGPDGPSLLLRTGKTVAVEPGSVIVNCTGHVLRTERTETPCLSPGGAVLTITSRSAVHFLASVAGYFLPHLFLTGKLQDSALYQVDFDALRHKDGKLLYATATTATFYNTLVLIDELPFKVLDECGLDLDRWFPLYRRLAALADVKWNR